MTAIIQSILGLFALVGIAFAFSEKRSEIPWKTEIVALGIKSIIAGTLATLMTGSILGCLWN